MLAALEAAGEVREIERALDPTQRLVPTGGGLCVLSKKLLEKIQAEEYVDFNELPPAKGKGRSMAKAWEGQVVVVQAADLVQTRNIIPDLATWIQCAALYVAVLAQ